jgi:hypothetical protein
MHVMKTQGLKKSWGKKSTLAAKWKKTFLRLKTKESEEVRKKPEAVNRNIMTPNSKKKKVLKLICS